MAAYLTTMSAKHHDPSTVPRSVASPHRPGHQLRRSITEQPPPFRQSRVHQYLHRKDREREDRLPLSAGVAARGSFELPRAEPVAPGGVADTGMVFRTGEDAPDANEAGLSSPQLPGSDKVAREQKEKAEAATARLKESLVELNNFSNATIARLDETYSSILQRLGSLQSTIVAMKELAATSQAVNDSFTSESRALINDIESQLNTYDQSEDQKKRIQHLQSRIRAGRDKVQALSERVDMVRRRIEGWEKADKEWQERTRRRLKVIWIIISIVALGLTSLFFGTQHTPTSTDIGRPVQLAPGIHDGRPPIENLVGNNSRSAAANADEIREVLSRRRAPDSVEPEVLRVFDEL
ncbi:hypothetical protein F4802DRAFT_159131 [Xylaria palmicola]|nr:hypothetical protein F4802DRAFT_159131 [Xylaria palmicola]